MKDDKPAGPRLPGGFGGLRWVLYALIAALAVGSLVMAQSGRVPDWEKCRESLVQQMFSDQCTPRRGFAPDSGGDGGDPAPGPGRNI